MRIDIHSHLMTMAFLEYLRGRDALPAAMCDTDGYITHCAPQLSMHYRAPILQRRGQAAGHGEGGDRPDLTQSGPAGPHVLGGAQADGWAARINDELAAITAAHSGRLAARPSRCHAELRLSRPGQPRLLTPDRTVGHVLDLVDRQRHTQ